ncbi:hypothetical protein HXX02_00250 [Microbulbifer elongatus]|uniref:Lipoprotein n=1 Tax=Microbulbifer elongatus TaxID=86173 RepID=A0ABT1NYK4_9GAMM|nr:hypothetical protein [Microbulbifer elongatus]MCQ3827866.1 hypothetical protein [Microbulbifer elongatus]
MKKISTCCALVVSIFLCACAPVAKNQLHLGEYIPVEITETEFLIGESSVPRTEINNLPKALKPYGSKKVLLTAQKGPTMGDLLQVSPVLSKASYSVFILNREGEPMEVSRAGS